MSATATADRSTETAGAAAVGPPRRPRRRRLWRVLLVVALVAVLAGAGWLVLFSSVLATTKVRVTGTHDLSAAQVQAAAQVPLGRPMARQDLNAIARRTTQLPQIAEARVRRDWPHTISITVVERVPVLAVAQPTGFVLIDKTGVAYESRNKIPKGVQQVDVNPDNVPLLVQVATVSEALPDSLRRKVDRVTATSQDNITLRLSSGVVVTWGTSADSTLKAQITEALLQRKPKVSIDVSSPHTPAFR